MSLSEKNFLAALLDMVGRPIWRKLFKNIYLQSQSGRLILYPYWKGLNLSKFKEVNIILELKKENYIIIAEEIVGGILPNYLKKNFIMDLKRKDNFKFKNIYIK